MPSSQRGHLAVPAEWRSQDVFVVAILAAQRLHDVSAPRDTRHRALHVRGHVGVATHVHVAGGASGKKLDDAGGKEYFSTTTFEWDT